MRKAIYTLAALEALATTANKHRFVGFDGDGNGLNIYTGDDDNLIEIGGEIENFAQEGDIQRQFSIIISNAAAAPRTAQLFAGYMTGNAAKPGQITDGAFSDINANAGLTAASATPDVTIEEMKAFLRLNPTRIIAMRLQSTLAAQLQQNISVGMLSLFGKKQVNYIRPGFAQSEQNFNDKIVSLETNYQIDDKSDIKYTVLANSDITLTFFCGASVMLGRYLHKSAKKAKRNISVLGAQPVIHLAQQRKAQPVGPQQLSS